MCPVSNQNFLAAILFLGLANVAWSTIEAEHWEARFLTYVLAGGLALVFSVVAAAFLYAKFERRVVFSLVVLGPAVGHGGAWVFSAISLLSDAAAVPLIFLSPGLAALFYLAVIRFLLKLRISFRELLGWSVLAGFSVCPIFGAELISEALGQWSWLGLHVLIWYGIAALALCRMARAHASDTSTRKVDVPV